jgi:hypothetical protein
MGQKIIKQELRTASKSIAHWIPICRTGKEWKQTTENREKIKFSP